MWKKYLYGHTVTVLITGGSLGARGLWSPCLWRTVDHKHKDHFVFVHKEFSRRTECIHANVPAWLSTLPTNTLTFLCSSHTPAAPPEESSLAPPAGWRRRCPPAPSGSPCGSRRRSAPPARPRSLTREEQKAMSRYEPSFLN